MRELFCRRCGLGPLIPDSRSRPPGVSPDHMHRGRSLCGWCYEECRRNDTLLDYPRLTRATADLLEDVDELWRQTPDLTVIAQRLGMKRDSLYQALRRAGRTGTADRMATGQHANAARR